MEFNKASFIASEIIDSCNPSADILDEVSDIISEIVNSHGSAAGMLDAIKNEAEMSPYHEISTALNCLANEFEHVINNTEDEFVTLFRDASGNYSVYTPSGESFAKDCLFYSYKI